MKTSSGILHSKPLTQRQDAQKARPDASRPQLTLWVTLL
jgi:hypothetical protein